jgi:thiol:disulfide interchange protein
MRGIGGLVIVVVLGIAALAILGRSGGAKAPTPDAFLNATTLDAALQRSPEENRPVLVFATADWCGPCQSFKRGALADATVEQLIRGGTIPVYADVTGPDRVSMDAAQRLRIGPIPALVLVWNGQEIARHEGNTTATALRQWLETGLANARPN